MKNSILLAPAFVLTLCAASCQNDSSSGHNQSSVHDSSHNSASPESNSAMMHTMDAMMKDMHGLKMTGNVDADFALMMKSHHEAAVEMAKEELKAGRDEKLKQMAQQIMDAQKSEIDELEQFIQENTSPVKNYETGKKDEGFGKVMDKSMAMMMEMPAMNQTTSADEQFVNLMIPHHQSAVYMAEGLVNYGKDARLISMAKKMIADQNREIGEFKLWMENKGK
ncbi:MAG: DUF305 domain-containing protein [Sphingobacteriaceae bacterium]|nr:DUF305 domain-containing protein [Sphingobacteriaceae bacterium]